MKDPRDLDAWVLELLSGLMEFENAHPSGAEHCIQPILDRVPAEVRQFAAGWHTASSRSQMEIEQEVRRQICKEEGCKPVESTRLGEADREFRCARCGETRTKPRDPK